LSTRKAARLVREKESFQITIDFQETYYANFDGLCEPLNPGGVATYGIVIRKGEDVVFEDSGLAFAKPWTKEATNNVAEYSAAIRALEWLTKNKLQDSPIVLRGDSRLIVNQLRGEFKVKAPGLKELHLRALKLLREFRKIKLEWIDRSRNAEADRLSRLAYRKFKAETRTPKSLNANSF
jgi:ribonuclease HI